MDRNIILRDVKIRENVLLRNAYLWMFIGLLVTAAVAFGFVNSSFAINLYNPFLIIVAFIVELVLVMVLSTKIESLSTGSAIGIFIGYSAVTGLTTSSIFLLYRLGTIGYAFITAAAVFGGAAVYGTVTKKNVSNWGRYLFMALIGLIAASLINMFFKSSSFDFIVCVAGVLIFTCLAVWDAAKIKAMNNKYGDMMTSDELTKLSILAALSLYLDFLNIFLYLLRIFGRSERR